MLLFVNARRDPLERGRRGAPRVIEGKGGHRYTVVHTGCIVPPPPPIITVGSNFPRQVGTLLCDSMV